MQESDTLRESIISSDFDLVNCGFYIEFAFFFMKGNYKALNLQRRFKKDPQ